MIKRSRSAAHSVQAVDAVDCTIALGTPEDMVKSAVSQPQGMGNGTVAGV